MSDLDLKRAPELTRVRRGHWRSRWHSQKDCVFTDRREKAGYWLGARRWPSAEMAEQKAMEWLATHRDYTRRYGIRFMGTVFFPDA